MAGRKYRVRNEPADNTGEILLQFIGTLKVLMVSLSMDSRDQNKMFESSDNQENGSHPQPFIRFKNYTPQTNFLDGLYTVEQSEPGTIRHLIQDKLDKIVKDEDDHKRYMIDPKEMEPKKANWDLKRRIEKRMDRLDRETRKAIDKHIKSNKSQPR